MAFPTDTATAADLAVLIPEVWGGQINDIFKANAKIAAFFTDRSDELAEGGDVLHTPNLTEMGANAKVAATAVTLNSPTETKIDLTVDQWYEVSFNIEDKEAAQVKRSYTLQERYATNAAYTIAQQLEGALAALFSGFSSTVGASTTDIADSEIRQAIATLDSANVPMDGGEVAFIMHPNTIYRQLMGIDKFTLVQNTAGADPVLRGAVGSLYGLPVISSTNVPNVSGSDGRYNVLAHRDAIHWATSPLGVMSQGGMVGSSGIRVQSSYQADFLSTLTTADILYGVIENRDAAGVAILTHATNA
jgi:hypothetical protein